MVISVARRPADRFDLAESRRRDYDDAASGGSGKRPKTERFTLPRGAVHARL